MFSYYTRCAVLTDTYRLWASLKPILIERYWPTAASIGWYMSNTGRYSPIPSDTDTYNKCPIPIPIPILRTLILHCTVKVFLLTVKVVLLLIRIFLSIFKYILEILKCPTVIRCLLKVTSSEFEYFCSFSDV